MGKKGYISNSLRMADLPEFRFGSAEGVITTLFEKGLANLFKKGLIENGAMFEFEDLIPKPYPA